MDHIRVIEVDTDDLQLILDGLEAIIMNCQDYGFSHDDVSELYDRLKKEL